jgi:ribosomal protein S18
MAFDPISGGIGLVGSLFGALGGGNRKAEQAAGKAAQEQAKWENETAMYQWWYQLQQREYEYNQALRIYDRSKQVYDEQMSFNKEAESRSYEAENAKMREYLQGVSFEKQDMLVNMIKETGKVDARGVSGVSTGRLANDVLSQFGRNNAIMAESLVSNNRQSIRDTQAIALQKQSADNDALSRLGLTPEKAPQPPAPVFRQASSGGGGGGNALLTIGSSLLSGFQAGYSKS